MELNRVVDGTNAYRAEMQNRIKFIKEAVLQAPSVDQNTIKNIIDLERRLVDVNKLLNGDVTLLSREFDAPPSISSRVNGIMSDLISTSSAPTTTFTSSYADAVKEFAPVYNEVKAIAESLQLVESVLEKNKAPYTPGRLPYWK